MKADLTASVVPTPMITKVARAVELKGYIGNQIGLSQFLEITQDRVDAFAKITDDTQWIHVDQERSSRQTESGKTIVHGFLLLSLFTSFVSKTVKVERFSRAINLTLKYTRFLSPVTVGSEVRARVRAMDAEAVSDYCDVTYEITIECKGQFSPACIAEWVVRYYG